MTILGSKVCEMTLRQVGVAVLIGIGISLLFILLNVLGHS
jgi:hypothetical protein